MKEPQIPVFKMLNMRNETDMEVLTWILIVFVGLPILMFLIHYTRVKMQAARNRDRAFEALDTLGNQKDLNILEQQTLEDMADDVGLKNPSLMLTSIDVFDRTVGTWMKQVQKQPWLKMFTLVERLQSIRQKIGFRYLAVGHPPTTTRELRLGQTLYMLAPFQGKSRLLSARIIDLDDLAIRMDYFAFDGHRVQFKELNEMTVFFWSDTGGEYQFKTQVLKNFKRPSAYLMLQHGDTLVSEKGRKMFSCDLAKEVTADWVQTRDERRVASVTLFDSGDVPTLAGCLTELSGSGFTLTTDKEVGFNDLVRLDGGAPSFLQGKLGRAVDVSGPNLRFKFHNLSAEDREKILVYITPRIPADALQKSTRRRQRAPKN